MTTSLSATNAYNLATRLANQTKPGQNENSGAELSDFGKMLSSAVDSVVENGKTAETAVTQLANGKANMVDVVTAVAETEVALETMVALRDRVISAYEEILRMPI